MILATLLALHGERMELSYFWSAILIVLLPVSIFVALGYWLVKMYRRERRTTEHGAVHPRAPTGPGPSP